MYTYLPSLVCWSPEHWANGNVLHTASRKSKMQTFIYLISSVHKFENFQIKSRTQVRTLLLLLSIPLIPMMVMISTVRPVVFLRSSISYWKHFKMNHEYNGVKSINFYILFNLWLFVNNTQYNKNRAEQASLRRALMLISWTQIHSIFIRIARRICSRNIKFVILSLFQIYIHLPKGRTRLSWQRYWRAAVSTGTSSLIRIFIDEHFISFNKFILNQVRIPMRHCCATCISLEPEQQQEQS